jgi:hypothetical protein
VKNVSKKSPPPPKREAAGAENSQLKIQLKDVIQYPDGSRYIGEMQKNLKHGKGTLVYCDGSTFEGEFLQGKRAGFGTRTSSVDATVFRGHYADDQKQGVGWVFGEDGSAYFGHFSLNERHGCGSFKWPRGNVVDREYEHGKLMNSQQVSDTTWPPPFSSHYGELQLV